MPEAGPGTELDRLRRRGVWLTGAGLAWTVLVAGGAIVAGAAAYSIALIGLGLEAAIEILAAGIVIWRLSGAGEDREIPAFRLISAAFLASAIFVGVKSAQELAGHEQSRHSVAGAAVAAVALLIMPLLASRKRRTGQALASRAVLADAAETAQAGLAAGIALIGVGLDTWLGWWWAVPAAGLIMAVLAVIEAGRLWRHHGFAVGGGR